MADINYKNKDTEGDDGSKILWKAVDLGGGVYAQAAGAIGPFSSTSAQITGQIRLASTATAVAGPDVTLANGVWVKALSGNAGLVYVGNNSDASASDFSSSDGFELSAGDVIVFQVANLNQLWFMPASSSDYVCWAKA